MANSSRLVLPTRMYKCSFNFAVTVLSYGGIKLCRIFEAHVVNIPLVHILSLTAMGIPLRSDIRFEIIDSWACSAIRYASSLDTVIKALTLSSTASMRPYTSSSTSLTETSRLSRRRLSSRMFISLSFKQSS